VEAVAASLYIVGEKARAEECLSIFKWGATFISLNHDPLEEYSRAQSEDEVRKLESEYFGGYAPRER
jgi:pre-rRNA-processing protein TSR3